jgi:hypothetical protein
VHALAEKAGHCEAIVHALSEKAGHCEAIGALRGHRL